MAVEGVPGPDLVLVQADLPPALLVALLYGPPLPGSPDQDGQGHRPVPRDVAVEEGQVRQVAGPAADEHPVPRGGGGGQAQA